MIKDSVILFKLMGKISNTLDITTFDIEGTSTIIQSSLFDISGEVTNSITVDALTIKNSEL